MKKTFVAAVTSLVLSAGSAFADWAPTGPVNLWIAFGPGGTLDTVSRVIADELAEQTGWQIVAENVPAGGGIAMLSRLANAPADGQTVGIAVNMPVIINLVRRPDALPFTLDSFDYLGSIVVAEKGLYVPADAPYDTLAGLMDHAHENGLVIAANAGPETVITEALIAASDGAIRRIATESGGQSITYVLGGHAQAAFGGGEHLQYLENGDIRMVASINGERLSYAPDVPTLREEGYELYIDPFFFFVAPDGLDPEAHAALSAALDAAVHSDAVREVVRTIIRNDVENFGSEGTRARLETGLAEMGPIFR